MASDGNDKVIVEDPDRWETEEENKGVSRRGLLAFLGTTAAAGIGGYAYTQRNTNTEVSEDRSNSGDKDGVVTTTETDEEMPEQFTLNFVPRRNEELRREIPGSQLEQYQREYGADLITESNIFSEESSQEFKNQGIDLLALEWWHDNDYPNLAERNPEMKQFIESINPEDALHSGIEVPPSEKVRNPEPSTVPIPYPNGETIEQPGNFKHKELENAETAQKALDWLHPYLFNWEYKHDSGSNSTEDEKQAATIQKALDQYTDLQTHAWSFDLPMQEGGTHGNGLIYDQTNDQLHVMETITRPVTATGQQNNLDFQLHPKIENSHYLPPEIRQEIGSNEEDTHSDQPWKNYWHPIRFNGTTPDNDNVSFRESKIYSGGLIRGIATGGIDRDVSKIGFEEAGLALTTNYLEDRIEKLRNYNNNEFDFKELKHESKIMNQLWERHEENAVIYLDENEEFTVATGMDDQTIEEIWKDQEGQYDNYGQILEQNTESAESLEAAGRMLEEPA